MTTKIPQGSTAVEIASSIDKLIRQGHWKPGDQLPAVRLLAAQLGVNANTVAAAYRELRNAGSVVTDGRRGTRVTAEIKSTAAEAAIPAGLRDMASGNVDGRLLLRLEPEWLTGYDRDLGYDACEDDPTLVELAKDWLVGHACGLGDPVFFSGALDAIERALVQRCRPSSHVLVEDPCWPPLLALLNSLRLKPIPMKLDEQGAMVPPAAIVRQASAVVITARAQNPTGASYTEVRWSAWQRVLSQSPDTLLIVDDYWGPLSSASIPSLDAFSTEWIYVLSLSKFLGPDLRIALASGNGSVLQGMRRRQSVGPRWVSILLQTLAGHAWQKMVSSGALKQAGLTYKKRRAALREALSNHGIMVPDSGEGLHFWLPVPDESEVVQNLAAMGWAVQAGQPFRLQSPPAIRVSIGNLNLTDAGALAGDVARVLTPRRRAIY
ncbi:aminotransferase class I/II-fold pyridoxal phosphate-dependent enzyme [Thermithiobacillus plumbiphilus]|uniref:Aminotransferase class I/II-fold pyridoxal phosphate-dependent enzyme n=1 Tax=Thermithiobacillus plumbiphilus TaxID=1729899 RepID=A0ABU9DD42_9PROT